VHVYADTSILFGLCYPDDPFFKAVNKRWEKSPPLVLYPAWLRFEVRHALTTARNERYGEAAWRALLASERHFVGVRENWLTVLQQAEELSLRHGRSIFCGSVDVLHVASAMRLDADEFWTGDQAQADLAKAAGLRVVDFSGETAG